jgi:hypothetical protein
VAGRHRAPRRRRGAGATARKAIAVLAVAAAIAAAAVGAVADDPRLLRGAIFGALVAALLAALRPAHVPHAVAAVAPDTSADLRRLRIELAELRSRLELFSAGGPLAAVDRPATLQLPLIRAAFAASGNGHANAHANGHANGVHANGHAGINGSEHGRRLIDLTTTPATVVTSVDH